MGRSGGCWIWRSLSQDRLLKASTSLNFFLSWKFRSFLEELYNTWCWAETSVALLVSMRLCSTCWLKHEFCKYTGLDISYILSIVPCFDTWSALFSHLKSLLHRDNQARHERNSPEKTNDEHHPWLLHHLNYKNLKSTCDCLQQQIAEVLETFIQNIH